jgi:hypothetical protein
MALVTSLCKSSSRRNSGKIDWRILNRAAKEGGYAIPKLELNQNPTA